MPDARRVFKVILEAIVFFFGKHYNAVVPLSVTLVSPGRTEKRRSRE